MPLLPTIQKTTSIILRACTNFYQIFLFASTFLGLRCFLLLQRAAEGMALPCA
jgi:hypothetical protein